MLDIPVGLHKCGLPRKYPELFTASVNKKTLIHTQTEALYTIVQATFCTTIMQMPHIGAIMFAFPSEQIVNLLHLAQRALHSSSRENYMTPDGRRTRNIKEVQYCLQQAIDLRPGDPDLTFALSTAYIFDRNVDDALKALSSLHPPIPAHISEWADYWMSFTKMYQLQRTTYKTSNAKTPDLDAFEKYALQLPKVKSIPDCSAILLPGHKLLPGGKMSSLMEERLKLAYAVLQKNSSFVVICSGGQPVGGISEASVMAEWLRSNGIPPTQIITEDKSANTIQNALFSTRLVPEHIKHLVPVSTDNHIHRLSALTYLATLRIGSGLGVLPISPTTYDNKTVPMPDYRELVSIALDLYRLWGRPAFDCGPLQLD
ncbi:YdcF family protein [Parasalinivibrio latis]|uniref:YdcF family protein n=1 Tax=Parasalinivibrio latis TaxID=2952610 RepID=UPI0030E2DF71